MKKIGGQLNVRRRRKDEEAIDLKQPVTMASPQCYYYPITSITQEAAEPGALSQI